MKRGWKKYLRYSILGGLVLALILVGYLYSWTGFGEYISPNPDIVRGKTLWDWMELLIIPVVLAIGAYFLNRSERAIERELTTDRQQEAVLQSYFDRMENLLFEKKLRTTKIEEVRNIAHTRTFTVLRNLDPTRKGLLLSFLYEAGLINKEEPVIDMQSADLRGANLRGALLGEVELRSVDLRDAILSDVFLRKTSLYASDLRGADLRGASIYDVDLRYAQLEGADLRGAYLGGSALHGASLEGAKVTNEQLAQAKSLEGATMPDGTKHE